MSNRLLVFNCSTDMALASGLDNYTPPPMIQCMERELELLPVWWADDGDVVLVTDIDEAVLFLDEVNARLHEAGKPTRNICFADWKGRLTRKAVCWNELRPVPWGWNKTLARRFVRLGLNAKHVPSFESLDAMRELSNRRLAVEYIQHLLNGFKGDSLNGCVQVSNVRLLGEAMVFVTSMQLLVETAQSLLPVGPIIFKAPWSSSGKGNYVVREMDESVLRWAKAVIMKQGGLCVDRFYNKRLDFAMEFSLSGDGSCAFLGYSLFNTDSLGRYEGNVVASQERILESIISSGADPMVLERLVSYHQRHLPLCLGRDYRGIVGVDMLLAEQDGMVCLHPCIEINLRMNMGVVALALARQGVSDCFLTPPDNPHFRARVFQGRFFIEK